MSLLNEAELHGLVDGHLDVDRHTDVLRRLAASGADRALVESWQEQNDLIRAAFRDVEREVLPVALDLAPPRLRCVDGNILRAAAVGKPPANRRRGGVAALATALVVAVGLVGSWLLIDQANYDATVASPQMNGTLDSELADRAVKAVDGDATEQAGRDAGLPVTRIPDLTSAGFMLTSASTDLAEPASLVFQYRDGGSGRVAISITRASPDSSAAAPTQTGQSFTWHRRNAAYALAGTLPAERLREIAVSLQSDDGDD